MTDLHRWATAGRVLVAGLVLVLVLALGATATWAAGDRGGTEVRVCRDAHFGEPCRTLRHGISDLAPWGLSNAISSFQISGGAWLMCTGSGFTGQCQVFDTTRTDLRGTPFQDAISSLRPVRQGGGGDWSGWGGEGAWQKLALVAYSGPDYTGRSWVFSDDARDLAQLGLNDQVSSLRVLGGRWRICRHADFRDCRDISADVPDLGRLGLDNQISSIQELGAEGWAGGRPDHDRHDRYDRRRDDDGPPRAVLYEDADFRGRSVTVVGDTPDLVPHGFNDRVSSVRLLGRARWQLCSDAHFRGNCRTVEGDVRDLVPLGLNDAVSSLRPQR